MADPQILYVVSAVVVLALVAWVIVVIARAPPLPYARKNPETVLGATTPARPASAPPAAPPDPPDPPKAPPPEPPSEGEASGRTSKLDAHLEIQDENTASGSTGPAKT
jgi:hypothetical protein